MFNRSCSVEFFVPHFWAALFTRNPLSRTSFTALVKVVDRLLFCVLQLLGKDPLEKACIRFDIFLPFPLTPLE